MKRLYVFGDSFTDPNIISNNKSYIKWKGYTPKTFHEIISERLNLEVVNFAKSFGMDNYTIFQELCNNINALDDSIVIINWGETTRFRMVDSSTRKWRTILHSNSMRTMKGLPFVNGVSDDAIREIFDNRKDKLWVTEVNSWINLINKALSNSTVVYWTWCCEDKRESITEETNGEVVDFHYSENGHRQLAEWILTQIENGGYLKSPYINKSLL